MLRVMLVLVGCGGGGSSALTAMADGGQAIVDMSSVDAGVDGVGGAAISWSTKPVMTNAAPYLSVAGSGPRLVIGGRYGIVESADGFASFQADWVMPFNNGVWVSADDVVLASDYGLVHSGDGGVHWDPSEGGDYGYGGVSGTGSQLLAVGGYAAILRSADGGGTWTEVQPPLTGTETYTDVWVDGSTAIIVGSVARRSDDGGQTWLPILNGPARAIAVWGVGDDVWAVGGDSVHGLRWFPMVYHSSDRGLTWTEQLGEVDADLSKTIVLRGVWGSSADDVYAVGSGGLILHTSDRGASWQAQTSGTTSSLNAIWGDSPTNIWVVGDSAVLHSE